VGISRIPCHWNGVDARFPDQYCLFLKSCQDTWKAPLGLFPEVLRSELREIRSVIEAYSNANHLTVPIGQLASGLMIGPNSSNVVLSVQYRSGSTQKIAIDRFD